MKNFMQKDLSNATSIVNGTGRNGYADFGQANQMFFSERNGCLTR
jgi:hypothetical protein